MFSVSNFEHNYTKSLFKYEEPISKDFKVLVNGQEATVYTCRISKNPINAHWPGHQRSVDQSELASFINIVSDEEALETAQRLAREEGLMCGISSGTNVAAAIQLAKKLGPGKTVVTVLPDTAERYFSTPLFEE